MGKDMVEWACGVDTIQYAPRKMEPIQLPVRDGSEKTIYQVKVVGLGTGAGASDQLSTDESLQMYIVWAATIGVDIIVPAVINIALPIKNFGGFKDMFTSPDRFAIYEDLINAIKETPGFIEAAENGDIALCMSIVVEQVLYEGSAVRTHLLQATLGIMVVLSESGHLSSATLNGAGEVLQEFANVLKVMSIFDIAFGVFDLGVTLKDIGSSNQAEIWDVDVTPPQVQFNT